MSSGKKIDTLLYQAPLVINNSKMAVTDLGVFIFFGGKSIFFFLVSTILFLKIPHSTDIYPEISKVDDEKNLYYF